MINNKYQPIIGLEVHIELNTRSKMFCTCSANYWRAQPNTHTCPICLGLPGALPFINKKAIESCIKLGLALKCNISTNSYFERKNYFYPDLPKGYQISQYRAPQCKTGSIEVKNKNGEIKTIRINRVHQEEDTAKLTHVGTGATTHIDFNRSGVPLVEIVTEPDFRDTDEIRDYAKKLQQIARYLGISNADMERGDMRLEANVSVRRHSGLRCPTVALCEGGSRIDSGVALSEVEQTPQNDKLPPYRVELKNINSFRFVVQAVEYEIARQIKAHDNGEKLTQETRGWDEDKKVTYVQRVKEEANDYRYFPDPDLPQLTVKKNWLDKIRSELPELPKDKISRFVKDYGITHPSAVTLCDTQEFADYFEECIKISNPNLDWVKKIANTLINKKFDRDKILPLEFIKILKQGSEKPILDTTEVQKAVEDVISLNPKAVDDYRDGKEASLQFLIGQVMAKTKGSADPNNVKDFILSNLKTAGDNPRMKIIAQRASEQSEVKGEKPRARARGVS